MQTGTLELQGLESSNVVSVASGAVVEMTRGTFNFRSGHSFGGTGTWWLHGSPAVNGVLDGKVLFAVAGDAQFDAQLAGAMWWTNGNWSGNLTVAKSGLLNFESMKISRAHDELRPAKMDRPPRCVVLGGDRSPGEHGWRIIRGNVRPGLELARQAHPLTTTAPY